MPLLLGVRLAARRPRRAALGALSVAVSVAGIVAVLIEHSRLGGTSGSANSQHQRIAQVLWVITTMLIVLAAINAILITWATVLDGRHASAPARALGARPQQVSEALSASQFLSVLPGSILGVPLGIALVQTGGKSSDAHKHASIPMFILVVVGTWLIMGALTAIPTRIGTRRSTAQSPASRKRLTDPRHRAENRTNTSELTPDGRAPERHYAERSQHQEGAKTPPNVPSRRPQISLSQYPHTP